MTILQQEVVHTSKNKKTYNTTIFSETGTYTGESVTSETRKHTKEDRFGYKQSKEKSSHVTTLHISMPDGTRRDLHCRGLRIVPIGADVTIFYVKNGNKKEMFCYYLHNDGEGVGLYQLTDSAFKKGYLTGIGWGLPKRLSGWAIDALLFVVGGSLPVLGEGIIISIVEAVGLGQGTALIATGVLMLISAVCSMMFLGGYVGGRSGTLALGHNSFVDGLAQAAKEAVGTIEEQEKQAAVEEQRKIDAQIDAAVEKRLQQKMKEAETSLS